MIDTVVQSGKFIHDTLSPISNTEQLTLIEELVKICCKNQCSIKYETAKCRIEINTTPNAQINTDVNTPQAIYTNNHQYQHPHYNHSQYYMTPPTMQPYAPQAIQPYAPQAMQSSYPIQPQFNQQINPNIPQQQPAQIQQQQHPIQQHPIQQAQQQSRSEVLIKSDLIGTVYLSPSPDADPFVKIGSHVSKGQTLCIIDCMKVMNPIEATHAGEIVHIHVGNAEVIEFAKPMFTIRETK
jgi:acetyl-CoA carboxylase biotin carboxyl carrier protein